MTRRAHILACVLCGALALVCALVPVVAHAEPAMGSITLLLGDGSGEATTDMVGGTIVLYRVASPDEENGGYDVTAGQFASSEAVANIPGMDSEELDEHNAAIAAELEEEALAQGLSPLASADIAGGQVSFAEVPEGLYLLFQTELSQGGRKMHTFLLSVPNEEGELNIVAQPKPGIYTPPGEDGPGASEEDGPTPGTPGTPEVPGTPGTPGTPEVPGAPKTPGTSDAPDANRRTAAGTVARRAKSIKSRVPQTGDAAASAVPVWLLGLFVVGAGLAWRNRADWLQ